jgi:protein-disulfide isomerase
VETAWSAVHRTAASAIRRNSAMGSTRTAPATSASAELLTPDFLALASWKARPQCRAFFCPLLGVGSVRAIFDPKKMLRIIGRTMTRCRVVISLAFALALTPGTASLAQQPPVDELKKEIEALREDVKALRNDVQEIKAILQSRPPAPAAAPLPPQNVVLDLGTNPFRGDGKASLTLIEFSDYQCPICARHVRETSPLIDKEYVATGKVKYVLLDFPLESIHKLAFRAAEAAHCAGDQGKYWEMHDRLFANQKTLEPLNAHASALGLNVGRFEACLTGGKYAEQIRKNVAEGQKAVIPGTPVFLLAYTDPTSSKVKTVARLTGAQPFSIFKNRIDQLLADQPKAGAEAAEKPR